MALRKQNVSLDFSQGVDTKTDEFQVHIGKFLSLKNSTFDKLKRMTKRNGFKNFTTIPTPAVTNDLTVPMDANIITTFNDNLTAIGNNLQAYSSSNNSWISKGALQPCKLDTLSLVRNNSNQTQCDSAIAMNGLVCTVYTDTLTSTTYKYAIADSVTGQSIVNPTNIPILSGAITGSPRVFLLGRYFVIVFTNTITAVDHLQYVAVPISNPSSFIPANDISINYTSNSRVNFDGVVANNNLYLAWNGNDGGGAIRMTYITSALTQSATVTFAGRVATEMSVSADLTTATPNIYAAFHDSASGDGYVLAVSATLVTLLAPTLFTNGDYVNVTSSAQNGMVTIFYEANQAYSYDAAFKTNFIRYRTCTSAGVLGTATVLARSVGLASKSFILNSSIYVLTAYNSDTQPGYYLLDLSGNVISKLAYTNGGGYLSTGLPSVTVDGNVCSIAYLFKDLLIPVNKTQGDIVSSGVYAQKGISLASFDLTVTGQHTAEIAQSLNLTGGFLWMYDGVRPVENNFFYYPDMDQNLDGSGTSKALTVAATGGFMITQDYFYVAIYEWTDNQGNIHRSAPSIPTRANVASFSGSLNSVVVNVPTLRLTYKTNNPVKIVIYRWSTAQQNYYQVTSVTSPLVNSLTVDSVAFTDTLADTSIVGNSILYTEGGVIENISPPSFVDITLYRTRLWGIDSEDQNRMWYSKQCIEATPVEMSDLFTLFVSPTTGAQGSTGKLKCLAPMDDKLIMFKTDAIYYMNGNGPDNTGTNNDFSEPIFITSTVGCANKNSIVFMPMGLMFQSDKGIWLLDRGLNTRYIGAAVEAFNQYEVLSALNIPETNQVRFTMSNGSVLMYDYFVDQWGEFSDIAGVSAILYQNTHTFLDAFGHVMQETPGTYLDNSRPTNMSFKTAWINLAGLQGYQRAYYFYLMGQFLSPHNLYVEIAYDYNPTPSQAFTIKPFNQTGNWGSDQTWGQTQYWGGPGSLEQWMVNFEQQRCQAFQITITEMYEPIFGAPAGAGFTLSGLNLVVGMKKGWVPLLSRNQTS